MSCYICSIADSHETGSTADTGQTIATDTTGTTITVGKIPYHEIHQNGLTFLPQVINVQVNKNSTL